WAACSVAGGDFGWCDLSFVLATSGVAGAFHLHSRSSLGSLRKISRRAGIALSTVQDATNDRGSTFGCDDPWTVEPGRIMADVLIVAALELGDPVLLAVLMETCDSLFHPSPVERRPLRCEAHEIRALLHGIHEVLHREFQLVVVAPVVVNRSMNRVARPIEALFD